MAWGDTSGGNFDQSRPSKCLLFPNIVAKQTDDGEKQQAEVEPRLSPQPRNDPLVWHGKVEQWRDNSVQRQSHHCESKRARDGGQCILCPDTCVNHRTYVGNQTHSEISAALPSTVSNTARYSVVPHTQSPEFFPSDARKSSRNTKHEKANRTCHQRARRLYLPHCGKRRFRPNRKT